MRVPVSMYADPSTCVCRVLCALVQVRTGAHTPGCLLLSLAIARAWQHKAGAISHRSGICGLMPTFKIRLPLSHLMFIHINSVLKCLLSDKKCLLCAVLHYVCVL